jgi:ATP diphosphatase
MVAGMSGRRDDRSTEGPAADAGAPIDRLLAIMARLRDSQNGCPWDLAQDFASIAPHTIEEAYEVADAIERGDHDHLKDELGDLLFQVVFYAQMSRERGGFDFDAVANAISDKMIKRHPHVFGAARIDGAAAQTVAWEAQKEAERRAAAEVAGKPSSALDGVIAGLPALLRAVKLQKRAARVGFDWPEATQVLDKIAEEAGEIHHEMTIGSGPERLRDEVGDLLFAVVNLARHLEVDPEGALRGANLKFERRFRRVEALLSAAGREAKGASLEELETLWLQAKAEER